MNKFPNGSPYQRSVAWRRMGEETVFLKWIQMKGYTLKQVGKMLNASARSVQYWAGGQAMPTLLSAFRIEQVTQGKVPVASWLGTALARAKWNDGERANAKK